MSQIHINREHPFGIEEARERVEVLRAKLKSKLGVQSKWQDDELLFKGSGATGKITVTDKDIDVIVKLGLLLSALAPSIEESISKGLDDAINSQSKK